MEPRDKPAPVSGVPPARPFVVIVGVEFDKTGDIAWEEVMRLVSRGRASFEVHLCHVVPASEGGTDVPSEDTIDKLQVFALDKVGDRAIRRVHLHVLVGDVVDELIQLAVDINADAIAIGTHRVSESRVVMGSVAKKLFEKCPCSVLVMRPKLYAGMVAQRGEVEADPFPPPSQTYRRVSIPAGFYSRSYRTMSR